jgi:hypothetical protein
VEVLICADPGARTPIRMIQETGYGWIWIYPPESALGGCQNGGKIQEDIFKIQDDIFKFRRIYSKTIMDLRNENSGTTICTATLGPIITKILDTSFRSHANGQHTHSAWTKKRLSLIMSY